MYKKVTGSISTHDVNVSMTNSRYRRNSSSSSSSSSTPSSSAHSSPNSYVGHRVRPVSSGGSTTLASVTLYLPPNWDELFHEVYYTDKEKEEAYEELYSRLALDIASKIIHKYDEVQIQQTWLAKRTTDVHNGFTTKVEAYIHRICLEQQDSAIVYRLLCCNKQRVFTHLIDKALMPNVDIGDYQSKTFHYSSQRSIDISIFHQEFGLLPAHLQLEIDIATQTLETTMETGTHLQFIHHKSSQSNMRIEEPLIYPRYVRSEIAIQAIYDAVFPGIHEKLFTLPIYFDKFIALINDILENIAQVNDKDKEKILINEVLSYKNPIFIAKINIDSIKRSINEIIDKKTIQQNTIQTLKARLIWAIHESIREYYLSMIHKTLNKKNQQDFISDFNRLFSPSVELNESLRLKFKNLTTHSLDEILNEYNRLLSNSYRKTPPTQIEYNNLFHKNINIVYKDLINDCHYFDINNMGYVIKNKNYYELLEKSDPAIIKQHHPEEYKKIQDNLKLLSKFTDFFPHEKLNANETHQYLEERIKSIESNLLRLKENSYQMINNDAIPRSIRNDTLPIKTNEKSDLNDDSKKEQALIDLIHAILSDSRWWSSQVKGLCPGTKIADLRVPHGIYKMASIQQTCLSQSPIELLRHYQSVARERLKFYVKASFFPIIRRDATKLFYQLLSNLNTKNLTDIDTTSFNDFLIKHMGKTNNLIRNDLPSPTSQNYSEPPSPVNPS